VERSAFPYILYLSKWKTKLKKHVFICSMHQEVGWEVSTAIVFRDRNVTHQDHPSPGKSTFQNSLWREAPQ